MDHSYASALSVQKSANKILLNIPSKMLNVPYIKTKSMNKLDPSYLRKAS